MPTCVNTCRSKAIVVVSADRFVPLHVNVAQNFCDQTVTRRPSAPRPRGPLCRRPPAPGPRRRALRVERPTLWNTLRRTNTGRATSFIHKGDCNAQVSASRACSIDRVSFCPECRWTLNTRHFSCGEPKLWCERRLRVSKHGTNRTIPRFQRERIELRLSDVRRYEFSCEQRPVLEVPVKPSVHIFLPLQLCELHWITQQRQQCRRLGQCDARI